MARRATPTLRIALALLGGAALALTIALGAPSQAAAKRPAKRPVLRGAACVPHPVACLGHRRVWAGGRLRVKGRRFSHGMRMAFHRAGTKGRYATARLRHRGHRRWIVVVPQKAGSGKVFVFTPNHGPRSRRTKRWIHVMHPRRKGTDGGAAIPAPTGTPSGTAFDGLGMWIWYISRSEGGDLDRIAARAKAAGVRTVFVKSSDGGSNYWTQFSPALVQALHQRGLKVCAWPFVYGQHPSKEAQLSIEAIKNGADCLAIDAEGDYEGRYRSAQIYIQAVRAAVGQSYPLGLAGFPYVDYHPAFPFSVFLGPGGAQFNLPQMYWKTIGVSVDQVYLHTYTENRIYGRKILPLGQSYDNPRPADIVRFRQLASGLGAPGLSYFSWQATATRGWRALDTPLPALRRPAPTIGWPLLSKGSKGDQVLWLQEHLAAAYPQIGLDGIFGRQTRRILRKFQAAHGIAASGATDADTWQAVLKLQPVMVSYVKSAQQARSARAAAASATRIAPRPRSASLPAVRDEIPARLGAGR